jgi:hypothetical protein
MPRGRSNARYSDRMILRPASVESIRDEGVNYGLINLWRSDISGMYQEMGVNRWK